MAGAIEPDTKDWTWVIRQRCPECGFDAAAVAPDDFPALVRENADDWVRSLAEDDVGTRPTDDVWSPLEYACHVRDVHRIFGGRVRQMLDEDDPLFANWDQDVAAVEGRYDEQAPEVVAVELAAGRRSGGQHVRLREWRPVGPAGPAQQRFRLHGRIDRALPPP